MMRNNFSGQYYKCQSENAALALISASHGGSRSVQLITDEGAWCFTEDLNGCRFGNEGLKVSLHTDGASAEGELKFGALSPLKRDIMGPFRFVPFMQCRHSVVSMCHSVDGEVFVNGRRYAFDGAKGYIEGDRGRSFPKEYLWTHSFFEDGSLMLSTADVPVAGIHFTGIICAVLWRGKEYRLATYLGAKAEKIGNGEAVIRQGDFTFAAKLIRKNAHILNAPVSGSMSRQIRESLSCEAAYRFEKNGKVLFEFETDRASFEYEYGGEQ